VLTFNRPTRRNALNREMLVALLQELSLLRQDDHVRAVIITGIGSAFCSGVDISAEGRRTFYRRPQQTERLYQEHGQQVVHALQSLPQISVAAVNGAAIGWGACLATCCDFRVFSTAGFLRIPEIGYGMYYDVSCLHGLLVLVGPAQARRLIMLGEDIGAVEAQQIGLADCVASEERLLESAAGVARSIVAGSPAAARAIKRSVLAMTIAWRKPLRIMELELATAYYGSNTDRDEGLAASRQRRRPQFSLEAEAGTLTPPRHSGEGGLSYGFPSE